MLRHLPVSLAASAVIVLVVAASASTGVSQTPPAATQARPTPPVDPLRRDFDALALYLQRKGALATDDRANAAALAGRIRESLAQSNDPTRWAMLAQIGIWTDDAALVDEAFTAILTAQPTNEVAMSQWIAALNRSARYEDAITQTNARFPDLALAPRVKLALVETLIGQNRFVEARTALDSFATVPPDLNAKKAQLQTRVMRLADLWAAEEALRAQEAASGSNPLVEIVTTKGLILVELFEGQAPQSASSMASLVEAGSYNGTRFHRRIPGFAVLGGDPNSKPGSTGRAGWGTVGWRIPDEGAAAGRRTAFSGTVGLCKAIDPKSPTMYLPDSAGAQFFFVLQPAEFLQDAPLTFTTVGRIIEGFDVAAALMPGDEIVAARITRKGTVEHKPGSAPELTAAAEMSVPSSKPAPVQRPPSGLSGGLPGGPPGGGPAVRPVTR